MFRRAKNIVINGGSFVANAESSSESGLDKLIAEAAPNAILNAGGRADEVRCFPGTREEIIEKLERFMDDKGPGKKRIMWLSGPAGAGKSAICQTLAERRSEQGQRAANFFFFRGDDTRNHSQPLVATLVYQLRRFYPALDEPLTDCLERDPLICTSSIEAQFKHLISSPMQAIQQTAPIQEQIVIIIDGLDECNNDERDQDQILVALHTLAHADRSPFRILVSSRAEPQLVMSFNCLGNSAESIFLNDDYQPQKDIRLFVIAKFAEIKEHHHLARTVGKMWPTHADIDAIVIKSSGQFIYAATVMRYIQFSSFSPVLSLATILEMPPSTTFNPLAHLDAVYSHIFSRVLNIQAVRLILFARNCSKMVSDFESNSTFWFGLMRRLVGYTDIQITSFFADLVAIIKVAPESKPPRLEFYHASLQDYLDDQSRSTIYCVNSNEIAAEFSSVCLRNICDAGSIMLTVYPLQRVQNPTPELSKCLLDASAKILRGEKRVYHLDQLIKHIERLYWEHDKVKFAELLLRWSTFVYANHLDKFTRCMVQPVNPSASQYYEQYWMCEEYCHDLNNPICLSTDEPQVPDAANRVVGVYNEHEGENLRRKSDGPYRLSVMRVKLHYKDDIRGMTLSPDARFREFSNKVIMKFGNDALTMKFKDETGSKITLRDESDYEFAIETARQSSSGKAEYMLEIWCEDSLSGS